MKAVIDSIIQGMIVSRQRTYTGKELREVIRTHWKGCTDHQIRSCTDALKRDPRISTQKVSSKKIYYSYKGIA